MVFGKGQQTEMKEISKQGALAKHKKYSQEGEDNPNWKNGISKDNYHYKKIQKEKYPEKDKARDLVHKALKSGKLIKPDNCRDCKRRTNRLHAHHEDYNQPLKVKWLCVGCHRERHR
ncbi:hypothetical protein LCGC14_0737880 [marine sediment metagenome]|uniref:Nuclease associated modular domain-containing protein n=1 Tax=marine sediment metagenome TaxID=412755 RepID=A0A0F9QSN1_9ZZZZ